MDSQKTKYTSSVPDPPPAWPDDSAPQDADVPTDLDDLNLPLPAAASIPSAVATPVATQASVEFSYYSSVKARRCQRLTLSEILKKQSEIPARVRRLMEAGEWEKANELKKKAPAWTPHATFRDRRITAEGRPNGYVCIDIDHVPNPPALQTEIFELPYVELSDLSIRGEGVYVLIRLAEIPADAEAFTALYPRVVAKLAEDMPEVTAYIDRATHDLTRLRFLSCQEYLHRTNPIPLTIDELPSLPPPSLQRSLAPQPARSRNQAMRTDEQQRNLETLQESMLLRSCSALSYDEWKDIGMALHAGETHGDLPSGTGLQAWLDYSAADSRYKPGECERKWRGFSAGKGIQLGTAFHILGHPYPAGTQKSNRPSTGKAPTQQRPGKHTPKREVGRHLLQHPGDDNNSASRISVLKMLEDVEQDAPDDLMAFPWPGGFIDQCATYLESNLFAPRQHCALGALVMMSTVMQHKAQLRLGRNRTFPQLYGLVIAPPQGYRKTSLLYGVREILEEAGLLESVLPGDITAEGIRDVILDQGGEHGQLPSGGTSFMDDASKMLFGDVTYFDTLRSFLLQASQGGKIDVARAGKGGRLKADNVRFSLFANTTPESFFGSVNLDAFADGLLTRFIMAYTDGSDDWQSPPLLDVDDTDARLAIVDILKKLATHVAAIDRPQTWMFPPLYFDWIRDENERIRKLQKQGESSDWYAGNWGRAIPRAGIFAIFIAASDWAMGNAEWLVVDEDTMVKAIGLAEHYATVADWVHRDFLNLKPSSGRQQTLLIVLRDACAKSEKGYITLRELKRNRRRALSSFKPAELERLIQELHDRNAITMLKKGKSIHILASDSDLPVR